MKKPTIEELTEKITALERTTKAQNLVLCVIMQTLGLNSLKDTYNEHIDPNLGIFHYIPKSVCVEDTINSETFCKLFKINSL